MGSPSSIKKVGVKSPEQTHFKPPHLEPEVVEGEVSLVLDLSIDDLSISHDNSMDLHDPMDADACKP